MFRVPGQTAIIVGGYEISLRILSGIAVAELLHGVEDYVAWM
jgi:hypothetical protein